MIILVVLLVVAVVLTVLGERQLIAADPQRTLGFHWRRPTTPARATSTSTALQVLALTCLLGAARRWSSGPTWSQTMLLWLGLLAVLNLGPRALVLFAHNRRVRGDRGQPK